MRKVLYGERRETAIPTYLISWHQVKDASYQLSNFLFCVNPKVNYINIKERFLQAAQNETKTVKKATHNELIENLLDFELLPENLLNATPVT